ncbi:arylsulfatase [Variovorax sp. J31P179]|uniref:arylsulfatase n=1 Tax=Variovorax sp. J31P179 TaxID=3053508 RepID=UPI002576DF02|nr:arylsulfatase [Variovorax sp. J31P179]
MKSIFLSSLKAVVATAVLFEGLSLAAAQTSLPFPRPPSVSVAGPSLAESKHAWRAAPARLSADAPNVLIVMLDDAGFAQADTVGGPIHTPTFSRVAKTGVTYNAFHTAAICSASRAAMLTGRNQHRVGNGVIAELATDWDGYTGEIPKSSATIAEVLREYGYTTAAFGKWHNTPPTQTTAMGPFDRWPTGHGFDTFYGFIGGETSQYEPRLYRNTTPIEPPHDPKYHLTEDLAQQAIGWLQQRRASAPDRPFFMYWAPGAVHGPHHVFKEWSDKYKGRFDGGWDVYREQAFERQKQLGWIPKDAQLTPRPASLPAWDSLDPKEKKFQARLMEVYAGFLEHTDTQVGKLVDELEREGLRENTLIFYVFSDNGASAEGMQGSIAELNSQNGIAAGAQQHMGVLERDYGGLDALGGPKLDSMYHAAWAWAGMTPFQGTKLVAGYFGGTRTPLAVSWPKRIKPDTTVRSQFHHVNDIAPTIYEIAGITPPTSVNGVAQDPIDGVSMAATFADARAASRKPAQYFENLGSRGLYKDGWMASVWGPRTPWIAGFAQFTGWNPNNDSWSLYKLDGDYSQAVDVSAANPSRLDEMKREFDAQARANKVYPLGAGLYPFLDPEAHVEVPYSQWDFTDRITRLPEFAAPNLRSRNSVVTVDAVLPADAQGVLYAMGGVAGGVTLYLDRGQLVYEYNALALKRSVARSTAALPAGRVRIEVETVVASSKPGSAAQIVMRVDGAEVGRTSVPYTLPLAFTATETFDVGTDLGSPVALDYYSRAPFRFNGSIDKVHVAYKP